MSVYLALWLPELPLQALQWRRRAAWTEAVAVLAPAAGARVVAVNTAAWRRGVRAGQTEVEARSLLPALLALPRSLEAEEHLQAEVGAWLERYSPLGQFLPPERWLLSLHGLERLLGEPRLVAQRLRAALRKRGLMPRLGLAAQTGTALLAAQAARHQAASIGAISAGEEAAALAPLPLELLRGVVSADIAAPLEILAQWGIRRLGELAALPRAALIERLGTTGLHLQQWARGEIDPVLVPSQPTQQKHLLALEFDPPLDDRQALLAHCRQALESLCQDLEARDQVIERIEIELRGAATAGAARRAGVATAPPLRWLVPHRRARDLAQRLEQYLEMHPGPAVVSAARLHCLLRSPRRIQPRLFGEAAMDAEKLDRLLARLRERLHDSEGRQVGSPRLLDLHRPDSFEVVAYAPPEPTGRDRSTPPGAAAGQPTLFAAETAGLCLKAFRPPQPVELQPPAALRPRKDAMPPLSLTGWSCRRPGAGTWTIQQSAGPWRSSGGWWGPSPWSRAEWDIEMNHALYRLVRNQRRWFLEGEYD